MKALLLGRLPVTALVLGVAMAVSLPAPAHAATAAFAKESEWSAGYVGKLTVRNDGSTPLTTWRVEFDLPTGTSVSHHWNAELTRVGQRHVFTSLPWNGNLAAGASTSFGWLSAGTGAPLNCLVNGVPCGGDGGGPDVLPPTVPANPRTSSGSQTLTLHWDASTDDRGVTGYEVFSNGTRTATTTGTSHTMPIPPPGLFTFGIRALDAAGNSSPFAIIKLGALPDGEAPSAPTNLRLAGPQDGHYRLTWDASRDNVFVAGYTVQQSGTVSGSTQVGDTFAYGVSRGYGTYLFHVRAFDSSGNLSAPASIGIAVDPPPPVP
ncbi:cellulose binding domain-containing protein [Micromonospora endolithica]|nr:cellulose binding domain-containing protein [Micromonospora endolithica]TWJ21445.1 cellulose binding domain-containing protein [Micromonospora endolithica]